MQPSIARTVDTHFSVAGVDVELVTFSHPIPLSDIFEGDDKHVISMSLTPQVIYSRGAYLDADDRPGPWARVGDVCYCPGTCRLLVQAPVITSYRSVRVSYTAELVKEIRGRHDPWSTQQLSAGLDVQALDIKRDLFRIVREISESSRHREKVVESAARLAMVGLLRFMDDASSRSEPPQRTLLAGWQMSRIRNYVEGMVDRWPTVDELARICEIGSRHLMRAFKATTGKTIGDYISEVRMAKAKSLLVDTTLTQKEIAYRLGFSGANSFSAAFGKAVGMTAKQFRDGHKRP